MKIYSYGSNALLVQLDGGISANNLSAIKHITTQLKQRFQIQIIDLIPAYNSLLVRYDSNKISSEEISNYVDTIGQIDKLHFNSRMLEIPVCFHSSFALDQRRVVGHCNQPIEDIKRLLLNKSYQVHMMGFLPGFAFMASVDESIHCPRLSVPRKAVPAGSLAMTGEQIAIYPVNSPGGWNIIGHCPIKVFDAYRKESSLFRAYDKINYKPITLEEHRHISSLIANQNYDYNQLILS